MEELEQERKLSPLPPLVVGEALVVPGGLLQRLEGKHQDVPTETVRETERVEKLAMEAVMTAEQALGYEPRDISSDKYGYDIESRIPGTGKLRFIEVKGRIEGADTVTVTKNEILTALNKPEDFILALVQVPTLEMLMEDTFGSHARHETYVAQSKDCIVRYLKCPFATEPDFAVTSVNYNWEELWERGNDP